MIRYFCLFVLAVFVSVVSGCAQNQTRIGEGAGIGGALGTAAGAIMGYQSGHPYQGALIGAAVGAGGGAAIGSQIKKPSSSTQNAQPIASVTMQQVVDWTKEGLSGDEIISRIKAANSSYSLTADDVNYLKKQGVSQRVIETMQTFQ